MAEILTRPDATASGLPVAALWNEVGDELRAELSARFRQTLLPLVADAEESGRFPREAIAALGADGVFRARWAGGAWGDLVRAVLIDEELGRAGLGGIGVGVSVQMDSVIGVLRRHGRGPLIERYVEGALAGELIGCIASSERHAGSELTALTTTATPTGAGWRIAGTKAYVSLGAAADFALVLCRVGDAPGGSATAPLALFAVPAEALTVRRRRRPVGVRSLETVELGVDAEVPDAALVGRPGRGLIVTSWALTQERLASAAQVVGAMRLAIALASSHLGRRRQFGAALIDHQYPRLRLAELAAEVAFARDALYGLTASLCARPGDHVRRVAALKVTVARLGERVTSECMHLFGAAGYLEEETPLARLWRDLRLARLGGGTDEMMLELTAGGLSGDDETYDELVAAAGGRP